MLLLLRRVGESVFVDDDIEIRVLGVKGNQVRIGIDARDDVQIVREELVGRDRLKVVEPAISED